MAALPEHLSNHVPLRDRASHLSSANRRRRRNACDCWEALMADDCVHAAGIRDVTPSALGCEEYLKIGSPLAVTKAFVSVMPMFSGGDVQKRPEAAPLRVVKTIVERLCCIGEFF
jgi:hypothetical protein